MEKKPMKVIVPLDEQAGQSSKVCGHFGSAPFYAVADMDANTIEIIPNASNHHDHGSCTPAGFFSGLGISVLLCNGIGAGAAAKLQSMGIAVYMAEMAPTLEETLRRFNSGVLKKVTPQQACQGHGCH
jgi:predicted Fe-Mo cluster-binding NifX family protein